MLDSGACCATNIHNQPDLVFRIGNSLDTSLGPSQYTVIYNHTDIVLNKPIMIE